MLDKLTDSVLELSAWWSRERGITLDLRKTVESLRQSIQSVPETLGLAPGGSVFVFFFDCTYFAALARVHSLAKGLLGSLDREEWLTATLLGRALFESEIVLEHNLNTALSFAAQGKHDELILYLENMSEGAKLVASEPGKYGLGSVTHVNDALRGRVRAFRDDGMDEMARNITVYYNEVSEFCHPNPIGTYRAFGEMEAEEDGGRTLHTYKPGGSQAILQRSGARALEALHFATGGLELVRLMYEKLRPAISAIEDRLDDERRRSGDIPAVIKEGLKAESRLRERWDEYLRNNT